MNGSVEINRIEYDGGPIWPDPDGASMAWSGTGSNNDGTKWHEENTATYGDGDLGTPGSWNPGSAIAVELTSFSAQFIHNHVILTWTTQTETENYGFHVYRSLFEDKEYIKITQSIIPGAGSSELVHHYNYTDATVEPSKTYYYKLVSLDYNGNENYHGPISVIVTGVRSIKNSHLPDAYVLQQSYPNPFNPATVINFSIKKAGKVSLKIYNLQGQVIRSLVDEDKLAGGYSIIWNGTNDQGSKISSGTYLYTLKVNGFEATKKLVFMK